MDSRHRITLHFSVLEESSTLNKQVQIFRKAFWVTTFSTSPPELFMNCISAFCILHVLALGNSWWRDCRYRISQFLDRNHLCIQPGFVWQDNLWSHIFFIFPFTEFPGIITQCACLNHSGAKYSTDRIAPIYNMGACWPILSLRVWPHQFLPIWIMIKGSGSSITSMSPHGAREAFSAHRLLHIKMWSLFTGMDNFKISAVLYWGSYWGWWQWLWWGRWRSWWGNVYQMSK